MISNGAPPTVATSYLVTRGRVIGRVIGIDWGVNEIATTTDDDYDFPHPERGKSAQ